MEFKTNLVLLALFLTLILIAKVKIRRSGLSFLTLKISDPSTKPQISRSEVEKTISSIPGHFVDPNRLNKDGQDINGFIYIEEKPPACPHSKCKGFGKPHVNNGSVVAEGLDPYKCQTCGFFFALPLPGHQAQQSKEN